MDTFSVFIYTICLFAIGSLGIGLYATVKHYQTKGKANDDSQRAIQDRLDNIEAKVDQITTEVRNKDKH